MIVINLQAIWEWICAAAPAFGYMILGGFLVFCFFMWLLRGAWRH